VVEWFLNPKTDIPPALSDLTECREKWLDWIGHIWRNSRIEQVGEYRFLRYAGGMDMNSPEIEYIVSFFQSEFERVLNRGAHG